MSKCTIPPIHWKGEDGFIHEVTWQGSYLKWTVHEPPSKYRPTVKRGQVHGFSRASRLRLLKIAATIDWEKSLPGRFITLTFPDSVPIKENYLMTQYRSVFWRYLEKHVDRHVSGIWRIEWLPRKSGELIGLAMPHLHILALSVGQLPNHVVNPWWKAILKVPYVRTDSQEAGVIRQCGAYVAKYCAKVEASPLVNDAYLNSIPSGRQWGILRKNDMKRCRKQTIRLRDCEEVAMAHDFGVQGRPERNQYGNTSYTLLGDMAKIVGQIVFGSDVDEYGEIL